MAGNIHAVMQDTDDGDSVRHEAKIDHVALNMVATVAWPDVIAGCGGHRGIRQFGAGRFQAVRIAQRLRQVPSRYRVIKNLIQVALRLRLSRNSAMLRGLALPEGREIEWL